MESGRTVLSRKLTVTSMLKDSPIHTHSYSLMPFFNPRLRAIHHICTTHIIPPTSHSRENLHSHGKQEFPHVTNHLESPSRNSSRLMVQSSVKISVGCRTAWHNEPFESERRVSAKR
jgi:hypothetical protein